jgi:polyhydroxyalkanoate synthesis regulator phasin
MLNGRRRWLALGALAAVLALGGGVAVAAAGAGDDGFLAGVAKRLGISEDKLSDAIRDESIARIDEAVQDGDLTEEQGKRLKERFRSGEPLGPLGPNLAKPGFGFGGERGLGRIFDAAGDQLEAAADYLGLTRDELFEQLSEGDSLADIAKEQDKSVDGLKTALRNALKKDVDEAVADGDLTREQADELYDKLAGGIDRLVEVGLPKFFGRGLDFGFEKGGFGFSFGFGPGGSDMLEAAADYLGLTEAQLREQLRDGDSLGDVAKEKGKSVEGLETALRNALKQDLDERVEDGDLTREQADNLYEKLSETVDELVENEGGRFGFRFSFNGPGGMHFRFGPEGSRSELPDIAPAPAADLEVDVDDIF